MAGVSLPATNLNLWNQRLGRVPESVWDQVDLETLVLAGNDLTEISAKIGRLRRLRMLDLGHNRLRSLPGSLGDLDGLSDFLYLHENRFTSLPPSLAHLQRLRYLNISENAFETLPECICGMHGLIELRASANPLVSLPDSLELPALRELHLRNTRLRRLPEAIAGLLDLRQIDLRGTPLEYLPPAVARLPRLEKLDLRWVNTLEPPGWFSDLEARGCVIYR
jgi:Leucine-rich repeat (LRR) protein